MPFFFDPVLILALPRGLARKMLAKKIAPVKRLDSEVTSTPKTNPLSGAVIQLRQNRININSRDEGRGCHADRHHRHHLRDGDDLPKAWLH